MSILRFIWKFAFRTSKLFSSILIMVSLRLQKHSDIQKTLILVWTVKGISSRRKGMFFSATELFNTRLPIYTYEGIELVNIAPSVGSAP